MNRWLLCLLLYFLFSACISVPAEYTVLEERVVEVLPAQSISIQIDYGEVTILESDDMQVSVGGKVLFDDELEYGIDPTGDQILIRAFVHRKSSSMIPLQITVRLPGEMRVTVETNDAKVFARDLDAEVEVASTSGDIILEEITGTMILYSNRGNITLRESQGIVSLVGNYGRLTTENVHGNISMSTIMGNIEFDGLIEGGDAVRLETDHGPVSINLDADSALTLQVSSTSGDVTCMLPDVSASTRSCDGTIGSGGGSLSVRTVSGAVTLQSIP